MERTSPDLREKIADVVRPKLRNFVLGYITNLNQLESELKIKVDIETDQILALCQGTGKKHRLDSSDREKELKNILDSYDEHWKQFIFGEGLHPSYSETRKQIIALIKGGNDG